MALRMHGSPLPGVRKLVKGRHEVLSAPLLTQMFCLGAFDAAILWADRSSLSQLEASRRMVWSCACRPAAPGPNPNRKQRSRTKLGLPRVLKIGCPWDSKCLKVNEHPLELLPAAYSLATGELTGLTDAIQS